MAENKNIFYECEWCGRILKELVGSEGSLRCGKCKVINSLPEPVYKEMKKIERPKDETTEYSLIKILEKRPPPRTP